MAIAFDANLGTVGNNATLTTSAAAASNSRIILFGLWNDATSVMTGGAWGTSLTWVVDKQYEDDVSGTNYHLAIASADAPSGLASSTSITPTFDSAVDFGPGFAAVSFTGLETGASGYVDVTSNGKSDFEEVWTTNNLVTTNADDLLVGFSVQADLTAHAAAANHTEIHEWTPEGSNEGATVYRIVASTGTYNPGGTWSAGSVFYQLNIGIAYKAAAGEAPEVPSLYVVRPSRVFRR